MLLEHVSRFRHIIPIDRVDAAVVAWYFLSFS